MSSTLHKPANDAVAAFGAAIEQDLARWAQARTPTKFRAMELEVAARCRELADEICECVLRSIVSDVEFQSEVNAAARQNGRYRSGGRRDMTVTLLGGTEVRLQGLDYLKENRRMKRLGRKRTKRGKKGTGFYPLLVALGFSFGVSPALAGEICAQVVDSDSIRAGRSALDRRGIDLGHKQTLRIVNAMSHRAVKQREQWLQEALTATPKRSLVKGKRVMVAVDGGRLRARHYRPGRRRKSGHRSYDAPWQEPKLLCIYVINEKGKIVDAFRPIYDGTLGDCTAIFKMLTGYLRAIGISEAKQLIVAGDGARWIWDRVEPLVADVGIAASRVVELVDWYHAIEKLGTIAKLVASWKEDDRKRWVKSAAKLLYRGKTDEVVSLIEALAVGRRAKKVRSHQAYFTDNAHRMQYHSFACRKIPRGSGAIESAMRRIVNLRLKSNAKFWREDNAEGMLLLRSYLKAGRFDDLLDWSTEAAAHWHHTSAIPLLIHG